MQECLNSRGLNIPFEVETRSLEEVTELVDLYDRGQASRVTRVMLDNMAFPDPSHPGKRNSPCRYPDYMHGNSRAAFTSLPAPHPGLTLSDVSLVKMIISVEH